MARVLVVDDELGVRESLRMLLEGDHEVTAVESVDRALHEIETQRPDLILLDLVMPERDGFALLEDLREREQPPPVMVVSATRSVRAAVRAMQAGAADYLMKPFDTDELRIKLERLIERENLEREVLALREQVAQREETASLNGLMGHSQLMRNVFRTIRRVADTDATVMVCGESGTGKELVARALHARSARRDGPLVTINCAAIPHELIERELFGHERGAFTGAVERLAGRFEVASGGTLFLDEIAEIPLSAQAKLLRALQERQIERLGGSESLTIDVRVIAATNRDLEREVSEGRFRDDLYYRLDVIRIDVPPLRDRVEDIRPLALQLFESSRSRLGRGPAGLSKAALRILERYPWPGNVRELVNVIEHCVTLAEGEQVETHDLPPRILAESQVLALRNDLRAGRTDFDSALATFERQLLLDALEHSAWNQTRAARRLGVTRRALKLKMDRLGLAKPGLAAL
ncbi:sigma-54 dependent transcriptional regulator [Myxococcota bacterium]|nr:sigma-54 dependent transcriptional regulator [Myxococcota bacterium]